MTAELKNLQAVFCMFLKIVTDAHLIIEHEILETLNGY